MSFFQDVLPLIFSILAIVAVLYLSYKFSKYLARKVNVATSSNNIKVLERAALGQDKGLAVIEVCEKYYLIGFANNNIEILQELSDYQPTKPSLEPNDFLNILKQTVKDKVGTKAGHTDGRSKKDE
ncbi:MAG TPA: flagellar biosynthetic protein FliO [Clostridiales bacterium]|nr:flagellar biosynthetic protein FliO [Clostridiales bacterium]